MAITSQEIPREKWRPYFEELTAALGTVEGTVEVIGRDVGDQIADERQVLTDMTYDDRDDALIVGLEGADSDVERVEHVIEHPQRVLVATGESPRSGSSPARDVLRPVTASQNGRFKAEAPPLV